MQAVDADILTQIVAAKRAQVQTAMRQTPLAHMRQRAQTAPPARGFAQALTDKTKLPVIAEIKRKSPSKGVLCENFSPTKIATAYAAAGAACLSVLTDEKFFGGTQDDLQTVRAAVTLPVLRKDFMLNEWQIFESRAMGADAVLLIAAVLNDDKLTALTQTALTLGMAVLVEVHEATELRRALQLPPDILLGINNRNLKTFRTDVQTTLDMLSTGWHDNSNRILVSESGIHRHSDVKRLQQAGVDAFLIGEALVQAPQQALYQLFKGK